MFQQHEHEFLFPVKLNGRTIYCLEEEDAAAVKAADQAGRPIPLPKHRRLIPFGQGIKIDGERIDCYFQDTHLGTFRDLKAALKAWDVAERYERFVIEEAAKQAELDSRYYGDLTFDEDGYKIFKPRPLYV